MRLGLELLHRAPHEQRAERHRARAAGVVAVEDPRLERLVGLTRLDDLGLAHEVARDLSEAYRDRDGPGVWHYEIGHELGVYLFNNPYMPKEEFVQYAKMKTDEWMEKK